MTLALLLLGLTTANAAEKQVDLLFSCEFYCAATWDAETSTFSWGLGGNNPSWTFMAAKEVTGQDISGDITSYKKLHLKMENFSNSVEEKLTVVFKQNDGTNPPAGPTDEFVATPDENGVWELDLTTVKWTIDKTKLQDLTIYGGARTDEEQNGTVKVTEAYLVQEVSDEQPGEGPTGTEDEPLYQAGEELPADWGTLTINDNGTTTTGSLSYAVHEWRTMSEQFDGPAEGSSDQDGIFAQTFVRSSKQAFAAGNAIVDNGNYASWDSQFFINMGEGNALHSGDKIQLKMKVKARVAQTGIGTQSHFAPGDYLHWACVGNVNFTEEWTEFDSGEKEVSSDQDGFYTIAFNLAMGGNNTYCFT